MLKNSIPSCIEFNTLRNSTKVWTCPDGYDPISMAKINAAQVEATQICRGGLGIQSNFCFSN
jgi:hypothetical protein